MADKRSDSAELILERLTHSIANDMLDREVSMDSVQSVLRAAGIDPLQVQRDASDLAGALGAMADFKKDRGFAARPSTRRRRVGSGGHPWWLSREQLVARVNALRSSPQVAGRVTGPFQRVASDSMSEEELRTMLEELESLFESEDDEKGRE